MITKLSAEETREIVTIYGITAESIPSYGLKFIHGGRDILIGINHNTGQIQGFDLTVYEDGVRVNPTEAREKVLLLDAWKMMNYPSYLFSQWGAGIDLDDKVITALTVAAGLFGVILIKDLIR